MPTRCTFKVEVGHREGSCGVEIERRKVVQTFLPYHSFQQSAECLDFRRLGKQRLEAYEIHCFLTRQWDMPFRYKNHPAVLMWHFWPNALARYYNIIRGEWIRRGYRNTMELLSVTEPIIDPIWLGDVRFHASHRSNLLRKDSFFYGKFGWMETADLPYFWPTKDEVYKARMEELTWA